MADIYSNGKIVARTGYAVVVPGNNGAKQSNSGQSSSIQTTERARHVDKQTGIYAQATNKEVFSTGDTFKERSTGRVGYKDEYKTTSTYKVGDKSGYTEYQVEERFRNVSYGGSGSKSSSKNIDYYY